MLGDEAQQGAFGLLAAQLDGAGGKEEVDLLGLGKLLGRKEPAGGQKLVAGIGPAARLEKAASAVDEGTGRIGYGSGRQQAAEQDQQKDMFAHR